MPINPELKHLYPPDWKAISRRIRFERAGGKCERCGIPHGARRDRESSMYVTADKLQDLKRESVPFDLDVAVFIVLTTAHLNHNPADNREENLAALCQKCHLAHDLQHHLKSRRINREKATGQVRLFER